MATKKVPQYFLGGGKCYMGLADGSTGMTFVGEASALSLEVEVDEKKLKNYSTPGGGDAATASRVDSVMLNVTTAGFSKENVAKATFGEGSLVTGASVTDEEHTIYANAFLRPSTNGLDISAVTLSNKDGDDASAWSATTAYGGTGEPLYAVPTVANTYYYKATTAGTSDASEPTWPTTLGDTVVDGTVTWTCIALIELVADTDYVVESTGVLIYNDAVNYESGRTVNFDYTYADSTKVEAILNSGKEYKIHFSGFNWAESDATFSIDVYRAKNNPASLGVITDDYGNLELTFTVLKDESITGTGLSQFYTYNQIEA